MAMSKRERQQGSAANTTDSIVVYGVNGQILLQGPLAADDPVTDDGEVLGIATGEDYDPGYDPGPPPK